MDASAVNLNPDVDLLDWSTEVTPTETVDQQKGPALSDEQLAMLTFEKQWWRHPGAKEQAIREVFKVSPTRYYQSLNTLLDAPDAMAHDPALVNRLRRLRSTRLRARSRD